MTELLTRAPLLRDVLGETLRAVRMEQGRTLREVSEAAGVSLGYLSEIERGHKEASSELLAAICGAMDMPLAHLLTLVAERLDAYENVTLLRPRRAASVAA